MIQHAFATSHQARRSHLGWKAVVLLCAALTTPCAAGDDAAFRAYRLEHVTPRQAESALRAILPAGSEIIADESGNRVLIGGGDAAQRVATDALRSLDRPALPPPPTPTPANAAPQIAELKTYPQPPQALESTAAALRAKFANDPRVKIVTDARTSQILVVGPPEAQATAARLLMEVPTPKAAPPNAAPTSTSSAGQPAQADEIRLWNVSASAMESQLQLMLGNRLAATGTGGSLAQYRLALRSGETLQFEVNRAANTLRVVGPSWAIPSFRQLVAALDAPAIAPGVTTRLASLSNIPEDSARRAADAVRMANGEPTGPAADAAENRPRLRLAQTTEAESQDANAAQPEASQPAQDGQQPPADEGQPGTGAAGEGGLIGPVQIEFLEGLDVLVVRGNRRDVERVMQIIRQIEELSTETEPEIRVVPIQHVDCQSLIDIVSQVYQQVFAARRGTVSMTPLVKPNAVLLVGRQESVRTVLDLIWKLDKPVSPETEFRVFPLRHASATAMEQRLTTFYQNRSGLGTQVQVTSDFRTNSLVVQAAPRDMEEVAAMIERLDVPSAEAVNEIRVFTLKNSLATELASVLQQAIAGQFGTQGALRQTATGQVTTAQGGGAGQGQQANEARSTRLRFLTLDAEGRKLLESGILTDVRITADTRANAVIVTAPADSMPLMEALVTELDRLPSAEAQVKVFTIVHGDAQTLSDMLQTLFGQLTTQTAAQQPAFRTGAQEGESSLIPLRFAVDPRTNSIIATGSAGDLTVVEAILLRLDESEIQERTTRVFRLKNAPANDVATAINNYLTNERQVRQLNPDILSTFEFVSKEVVVVPEPVSNSLIVSATPQYFDEIVGIVEDLDERPPMVLIQVLIGEVQLTDNDEFGIELGIQDSVLFNRSVAGVPGFLFNSTGPLGNNTTAPGPDIVGAQAISNFGVGRGNSTLGFGGMVLSASSEAVSVLIRALQQNRRLDVLSRPQVMALDNQAAFIQVGQRVPTITGTSVTQNTQVNSVSFTDTGLILLVRPRISPDGQVVLEINAEKSDVGPESEGIPISVSASGQIIRSPRINTTRAQTTVSAADGQTIILGGLITKSVSQTKRRIPGLSDFPILKHLFRYDAEDCIRTELLIVLTPHVVRSESDVERIRQIEAARMHWCLADVAAFEPDIVASVSSVPTPAPTPAAVPGSPQEMYLPANPGEVPPELVPIPSPQAPATTPRNPTPFQPETAPGSSRLMPGSVPNPPLGGANAPSANGAASFQAPSGSSTVVFEDETPAFVSPQSFPPAPVPSPGSAGPAPNR
ncbi:secretin N-terminal domain-containing protein [Thermopirellula anaerolimosa]